MDENRLNRRNFLQSAAAFLGLAATGSTGEFPFSSRGRQLPIPTRKLGRTGVEIPILALGGALQNGAHTVQHLERAWEMGIRYFDVADCYSTVDSEGKILSAGQPERNILEWLRSHPERRSEIFLVSKGHPAGNPLDLLRVADERLAACGTDYLDLLLIHGLGFAGYGKESIEWPKSRELKEVAEKLKKSGKVRLLGFSTHEPEKALFLNAAAQGGFVDAILVAYSPVWNPWFEFADGWKVRINQDMEGRDGFYRALDACHRSGIGLIAMKTTRGVQQLPRHLPEFKSRNLNSFQAMLQATWDDERFSAICSMMNTEQQLSENTRAAREFRPLSEDEREALRRQGVPRAVIEPI